MRVFNTRDGTSEVKPPGVVTAACTGTTTVKNNTIVRTAAYTTDTRARIDV
jgi:hypothetical protein